MAWPLFFCKLVANSGALACGARVFDATAERTATDGGSFYCAVKSKKSFIICRNDLM